MSIDTLKPQVINHRASRTAEQLYFLFQNAYRQEARLIGGAASSYFLPLQRDAAAIRLAPSRILGLQSRRGEVLAAIELIEPNANQRWCQIDGLCVDAQAQRKGYASQLIHTVVDLYTKKGVSVRVKVAKANGPALALYDRFQFQPIGTETQHGVELYLLERSA
ncbi:GNAT family N-acetyltransferase [Simiduia aestuariiviva]|uniref:Ribosomal protein S18 acetylase RimI-like enzyme n=1 Tax=Simiduia aestuariiviva TaxID=1510459 RepID=A0A839UMN0_9GAMM|nr:GNAT family N-acetyltransferase [Simiduia aestuariiviva]MBB3168973.1 ribosomal protein S18 acetylase RimI-like enzyme [Simiduia aestuariiviva]